jgi:hypothetical protein
LSLAPAHAYRGDLPKLAKLRPAPTHHRDLLHWAAIFIYICAVAYLAVHCFRHNAYSSDTAEFVGNVVALKTSDPVQIRDITYHAIVSEAPAMVVPHILGNDLDTNEARVRRHKFQDPYTFPQFLPYFSIKPLYIEALNVAHTLGFSLVRSIAAVSTASFLAIAVICFLWVRRLNGSLLAAAVFLFVPEIRLLGQGASPDGMSVAILAAGLYFVFVDRVSVAVALLMVALWVRPESSILVIFVLCYLAWKRKLPAWMAAIFVGIAVLTPPVINYFGGSYGWKALYSHTFKFIEMEPGQFTPAFTLHDYIGALWLGIRNVMESSALIFAVLFAVGYKYQPRMRPLLALCAAYSVIRFFIFPNYEFRYFSIFYLVIAMAVCASLAQSRENAYTDLGLSLRAE